MLKRAYNDAAHASSAAAARRASSTPGAARGGSLNGGSCMSNVDALHTAFYMDTNTLCIEHLDATALHRLQASKAFVTPFTCTGGSSVNGGTPTKVAIRLNGDMWYSQEAFRALNQVGGGAPTRTRTHDPGARHFVRTASFFVPFYVQKRIQLAPACHLRLHWVLSHYHFTEAYPTRANVRQLPCRL